MLYTFSRHVLVWRHFESRGGNIIQTPPLQTNALFRPWKTECVYILQKTGESGPGTDDRRVS